MQRPTFEISFRDPATHEVRRRRLDEAVAVPFAEVRPIRRPPSYRRQRNKPGLYFFSKTERHIVYESQSERMVLTLLDFDPEVSAVAGQPFALHLPGPPPRRHTPDFFVQLANGGARVVEVKIARFRNDPHVRQVAEWASRACAIAGWDYAVASPPEPNLLANVLWLSGFRRRLSDPLGLEEQVRAACRQPKTIAALEAEIGCAMFMRPILFHLLWTHELTADLSRPLSNATVVSVTENRHV
jgi:hypothetical protein